MRKTLRGNEKLFFNAILSALLRFILNLIFDFVITLRERGWLVVWRNLTTKSGCKSLMAVCFDFVFAVPGCERESNTKVGPT